MHSYRSLILYTAAVVLLSVAYFASPISRESVAQLFPGSEAMAQAYPLVTALLFLVASIILAFLAFPSMPMVYMAAGFYMDGLEGGTIVLIGSAFGGLSAFLFYRKHMRRPGASVNQQALNQQPPMNQPVPSGQTASLSASLGQKASLNQKASLSQKSVRSIWLTLIGLRLSPLVPAPLVNFVAVVFDVSPFQYLATSLLGSAPLVLFYWQIGQQGHQFLSGGTLHWRQFSGYLVILTLSTLLSAMGPWRTVLNEFKQMKGSSGSLQPVSRP